MLKILGDEFEDISGKVGAADLSSAKEVPLLVCNDTAHRPVTISFFKGVKHGFGPIGLDFVNRSASASADFRVPTFGGGAVKVAGFIYHQATRRA